MVITTAQLHSTKPERKFCVGSNPVCSESEIRDGEDPWQWSRLEIRLNAFHRSTIPQKQFTIIINRWPRTTIRKKCFESLWGRRSSCKICIYSWRVLPPATSTSNQLRTTSYKKQVDKLKLDEPSSKLVLFQNRTSIFY